MYCPVSFQVSFTDSLDSTAEFGPRCFQAKEGNGHGLQRDFAWRWFHEYWPFISILIVVNSSQIYREARTSWRCRISLLSPLFPGNLDHFSGSVLRSLGSIWRLCNFQMLKQAWACSWVFSLIKLVLFYLCHTYFINTFLFMFPLYNLF